MKKPIILFIFTLCTFYSFSQDTHYVNAGMYYYTPSDLTINQGDIVIWINDGGTHDVNGETNSITGEAFNNPEVFNSDAISEVGATIYTHTFNIPGIYNYDCSVYGHASAGMVGSITVEEGCIDDDNAAATLANMWNPDITGCEDAIPYLNMAGYPCETDLSVLGMSGTIADICQCTCENEVEDIYGCTDPEAVNYNENATIDDGSCEYEEDCIDDNQIISENFGNFFINDCDTLILYLIESYGYSEYEACTWDGNPMVDLGMAISEICECACEDVEDTSSINELNNSKQIVKTIDILGKETNKKGFIIEIYNDGSFEKKYIK